MTTLMADPVLADILIADSGEPLVDLATYGIACANRTAGPAAGRMVRAGVADRLREAESALPFGVRLLVVEGFRTVWAQRAIVTSYSRRVRYDHPGATDAQVRSLVSRYVAPLEVAPHVAGAAVDATLLDAAGSELAMGTPLDATPEDCDGAASFDAPSIGDVARSNRDLLASVLVHAGLVNYPTEWWHWSYGDRYWAHTTGADRAFYGPVVTCDLVDAVRECRS